MNGVEIMQNSVNSNMKKRHKTTKKRGANEKKTLENYEKENLIKCERI